MKMKGCLWIIGILFIAFLYIILPDFIPGPIDDAVVDIIAILASLVSFIKMVKKSFSKTN